MFLGALAGENDGTVNNVSVSGTIASGTHTGIIAGGVVGQNRGTITNSSSAAVVSVGDTISNNSINIAGGLVGSNQGSISQSSASGNVTGGGAHVRRWPRRPERADRNGRRPRHDLGIVGDRQCRGRHQQQHRRTGRFQQREFNGHRLTCQRQCRAHAAAAAGAAAWSARTSGLIELSFYGPGTVSGNGNVSQFAIIGGLAGQNQGTVNNSHATATVSGTLVTAGGLIGYNFGTVTGTTAGQTFADATIRVGGDGSAGGGLAGGSDSPGSIHNANATGSIARLAGAPDSDLLKLGGLVGQNNGSIDHSTSTATVTGGFSSSGGLVGQNSGSIMFSSASGNVSGFGTPLSGEATIGGLVGNNIGGASIANSSASGNVTGGDGTTAGGLVGFNAFGNTITASHATGNVSIDNPGLAVGTRGRPRR